MELKRVFALFCMIFISLLVIQSVDAAKIEGKIYDIELNTISGVKVTLNSIPQQIFVSTNGYYSFTAPEGRYTITADYAKDDLKIREIVIIRDEGTYTLDLILLPDLGVEEEIIDEASNIDVSDSYFDKEANTVLRFIIFVIIAIIVAGIFVLWKKGRKKEKKGRKAKADKKANKKKLPKQPAKSVKVSRKEIVSPIIVDDSDAVEEKKIAEKLDSGKDLDALMSFIRKEDGRTTQKDIRKQFPLSEAKISLMIAELEDKGLIKKIKQGRGNIIVLK